MLRLADPWFLAGLAVLPLAWWWRSRGGRRPSLAVSSLASLELGPPTLASRLRLAVWAMKYLALALIIVAAARPQWGVRISNVMSEGVNIVLAVDTSESMIALDFEVEGERVDRLQAVKNVASDFIAKRNGDRIGVVVFGTEAYTQVPLTRDYQVIEDVLKKVMIGAAGKNTAIGDGLGISLKRLGDVESKSNVVILLTDGQNNAGSLTPAGAAEVAREMGVKVYTIGVGTRGRAPIPVPGPFGGTRIVHRQVNIDEDTLKQVAEQTGGLYFRATDTEGLKTIYDTIDQLEKSSVEVKSFDDFNDLYHWFAWPGLGLLGLWIVLSNTRFVRLP